MMVIIMKMTMAVVVVMTMIIMRMIYTDITRFWSSLADEADEMDTR